MNDLEWGYKLVGVDLTTDDHQGGRFRYRPGEWAEAPGPFTTGDPCPRTAGDGLCVARTFTGAGSGGARLGSSAMLVVGYDPADVLGSDGHKVRVRRLFVASGVVDPVRAIIGPGAVLRYAVLRGAVLRYADLRGADLRDADLSDADLSGADLSGAYLSGPRPAWLPAKYDLQAGRVVLK